MNRNRSLKNRVTKSLTLECLERRETPAQFGLPWADAMHLSMSFAPDGTKAADVSSNLQTTLDTQMGRDAWKTAILKAAQIWSQAAGVNIGVTNDSGIAFGAAGEVQGDSRMGDIRVGGFKLSPEVLAISSPPSNGLSGTIAGDVFINTQAKFTPNGLLAAALHEIGHTLGVPNSTNPRSVMYTQLHNNTTLAAEDIQAIRALYGVRGADLNEDDKGNGTFKEATRMKFPSDTSYDGAAPLVQFGDITTAADVDIFYLRKLSGYSGPVTFKLKTEGISLLQPKLTIYDEAGRVVRQLTSTKVGGDTLQFTLPRFTATHYLRIESIAGSDFRVGRYALSASFDNRLKPTTISLDAVMKGPYDSLDPDQVDELFHGVSEFEYEDDLHTDDTAALAVNLRPSDNQPFSQKLSVEGTITDATDIDFYRLRAPSASTNSPWVLTLTLSKSAANGVIPDIQVLNGSQVPMNVQVISRTADTLTIQATGIAPNASIYVRASGAIGGNYVLSASFGRVATNLQTFGSGELTSAISVANYKLYAGQSQVFGLTLSSQGGPVELKIKNSAGAVVFTLLTPANGVWSGVTPILPPGEYTATIRSVTPSVRTRYTLKGDGLTDPIGPVINSATLKPQYQAPQDPTQFLYPNGTLTKQSAIWILMRTA